MAKGGKRPGAGRKSGSKGRLTIEIESKLPTVDEIIGKRDTPLKILVDIYSDPKADPQLRCDAAGKALQYVHRKQPEAHEHTGDITHHLKRVLLDDRSHD